MKEQLSRSTTSGQIHRRSEKGSFSNSIFHSSPEFFNKASTKEKDSPFFTNAPARPAYKPSNSALPFSAASQPGSQTAANSDTQISRKSARLGFRSQFASISSLQAGSGPVVQRKLSVEDQKKLRGMGVHITDKMSIEEAEDAIRKAGLEQEVALLFDKNDEIIGVNFGAGAEVSFPEAAPSGANTVTHNHPKGNSLSWVDIQAATGRKDVIEVAAVTPAATFVMFVPYYDPETGAGKEAIFQAQKIFHEVGRDYKWPEADGVELDRLAGAIAVGKLPGFDFVVEPSIDAYLEWFSKEKSPIQVNEIKAALLSGKLGNRIAEEPPKTRGRRSSFSAPKERQPGTRQRKGSL